jgi:hypothetical protein
VETPDRPKCADRFMWTGFCEDCYRDKKMILWPAYCVEACLYVAFSVAFGR